MAIFSPPGPLGALGALAHPDRRKARERETRDRAFSMGGHLSIAVS
jgi:hypothetical protein